MKNSSSRFIYILRFRLSGVSSSLSPGSGPSNARSRAHPAPHGTEEDCPRLISAGLVQKLLSRGTQLQTGTALLQTQSAPAGLQDIPGLYIGQALTFQTTFWQMLWLDNYSTLHPASPVTFIAKLEMSRSGHLSLPDGLVWVGKVQKQICKRTHADLSLFPSSRKIIRLERRHGDTESPTFTGNDIIKSFS